jgi:hypothetical protein
MSGGLRALRATPLAEFATVCVMRQCPPVAGLRKSSGGNPRRRRTGCSRTDQACDGRVTMERDFKLLLSDWPTKH